MFVRGRFALVFTLFIFVSAFAHAQGARFDLHGYPPYRADVPTPESVLGYELGATHSTFRDSERVLLAIADAAKDRVRVIEYGKSAEGRPLRVVCVGSPETIARLDSVKGDVAKLADGKSILPPAEREHLILTTPVVVWVNECIHGSETASFESALWLVYTLAASDAPTVAKIRERCLVIVNPVYNPDGHERFAVWYNSVAVGSIDGFAYEKAIPWSVAGRFNHFRFDLNRDLVAQSQPETRYATAITRAWHPQVYIDQHGQPDTYFFPPNAVPSHQEVDNERVERWTKIFGSANGVAFDSFGWPYVNRETYDFLYPGYLDTFTTLMGAIGMTYETDGGGNLARRQRDGTVSTLRDAALHHFVTALTTLQTASAHHDDLWHDFVRYRQSALHVEPGVGKMRRVIILPPTDTRRLGEFVAYLLRLGIVVQEMDEPLTLKSAHPYRQTGKADAPVKPLNLPAGAIVVDIVQAEGHLARTLLEPSPQFPPDFVKEQLARRTRNHDRKSNERREGYDFYDTTAWSLPLAFDLTAYWSDDDRLLPNTHTLVLDKNGDISLRSAGPVGISGNPAKAVAFVFPFDRDGAALLALQLLRDGYRLSVVTRPLPIAGQTLTRGTIVARVGRNPQTLATCIAELAKRYRVSVAALSSAFGGDSAGLGSDVVVPLHGPRVAVVEDDNVEITGFGSVWHTLQAAGQPFTPIRLRSLNAQTLSRFNVLILPDGFGYAGAVGRDSLDALRAWVQRGGALIGLGGGGVWFGDKEVNLSSVVPVGSDRDDNKPKPSTDKKHPMPPASPTNLPGAIFAARIDPTHFLGYGYPDGTLPVPLADDTFLRPSKTGVNVVTFAAKGPLTLSGWVWPNDTEALLHGTAYVVDEPTGAGHVLLFLADPTQRALFPGLRRLFLSGILFAPQTDAVTTAVGK